MKVSSAKAIKQFNPDPHSVKPMSADLDGLSTSEVAATLAQGHPKSVVVKLHKGTEEGPRTGVPHLSPHSLRYQRAHAACGTTVAAPGDGP